MSKSSYMVSWIGSRIRTLRKEKKWKLGELSELTGISNAMLSKIENGRVFPTFPTLLKILNVLEIQLNDFFEGAKNNSEFPGYILVKQSDYQNITKEENSKGFNYKNILNYSFNDVSMEISLLNLEVNAQRETVITEGFEYIYMLKGQVTYQLEDKLFKLEEGDSLFFDGRIPHVPHNNSEAEVTLLVLYFINQN